jgi:hypothetical protein
MEICNPSCVTTIPSTDWANACDLTTRDGGIPRLTFLKCDESLELPYSPAVGQSNPYTNIQNVMWALCNGYLYVTGELIGQKPKGSFTKRRLTSCGPERVIAGAKTVTFQDFNADKENLLDFDFWKSIETNRRFLFFGFITCDERWYQWDGQWDLEVDEVIEDTSDGKSFYDGTITMNTKDILKPIVVPGILDALRSFNTTECAYY